ncbi:MAG: OmpA family protein [Sphingobacteriales bacterium]|nr:OmpA family protein [Sphingobacteriales bacterium]
MKPLFLALAILSSSLSGNSQHKETFSVYFDFDKYVLAKNAIESIDSSLQNNKPGLTSLQFELKGHCDNRGTDEYNYTLSEKRVLEVKRYLLDHGVINELILSAVGLGESAPMNENKTEDEQQLNRRVDITIRKPVVTAAASNEPVQTLKEKIADTTVKSGTNIILHNINFVGGMHQFLPESIPMLSELLDAMRIYPLLVIRVEGHICCIAGEGDGPDLETGLNNLSEARAKAVMDNLISNGIDAKRISFKGFGHSSPLYSFPEKSEEEMKLNRRVEIKIISK